MSKLDYAKVVHCPQDDSDVNILDCLGCDYYESTDDFAENIECKFEVEE